MTHVHWTRANKTRAPRLRRRPAAALQRGLQSKAENRPEASRVSTSAFELPALELFDPSRPTTSTADRRVVQEQADRLKRVLAEFRITGEVTEIHVGPSVTRYAFEPEAGIRLSRIEGLESNIAMALAATRIRILAPIPGTTSVGFEIPNPDRQEVPIHAMFEQAGFGQSERLPLALGKDITGRVVTTDLSRAPHLLVAGATGSGKSVGLNAMLCSLLKTRAPEDVRMLLIDLKKLELSVYEGVPHLLVPVVTEAEKATRALEWAVAEMERRYTLLSEAKVRDIAGYNRKLPELQRQWDVDARLSDAPSAEEESSVAASRKPRPTKMPYLVIVIDEFADLMMVANKEVEPYIARIAGKARAAGIHLIVATQRPSVDVITGTIKNNFPSRIAFQMASEADSRTILDGKGAKQLVGMGDMLHVDRGHEPRRVQGCFVSDEEVVRVVDFVKRQAEPDYEFDIVRDDDEGEAKESLDELYTPALELVASQGKLSASMLQRELSIGWNRASKLVQAMKERGVETTPTVPAKAGVDPLYDAAVDLVVDLRKASTSMLQRKLSVGYNRAAKLIERMESEGVVGPPRGNTGREVLRAPVAASG